MPRAEQRRGVTTTVAHDTLIPDGDSNTEIQQAKNTASQTASKLITVGYRIDAEIAHRLKMSAARQKRPAQAIVEELIREYLEGVGD